MNRSLAAWTRTLALAGALLCAWPALAGIITTKHNLAASGPGTVKAATETQVCVFCHAPHNSTPGTPLWNRQNPGGSYTVYSSVTTMKASVGQPTGGSLLCLSCHDGTIALGQVLNRTSAITMAGGVTTMPTTSASRLGTDISGDHPISFAYTSAVATARGELVDPSALTGAVQLRGGQMQCSSCHDAHNDPYGKFLVMSNTASALCQVCHKKNYWNTSDHALSTKTWNGVGTSPWTHTSGATVAANACEGCHRPHTSPGKKWLQNAATEEGNCYPCHNGNVAAKNIQTEFNKASIHPVAANTGVHDPSESTLVGSGRHVECVDCHNPHASNATTGTPVGSLIGVRGMDINGSALSAVTYEYQTCFRCHGDSTGQPAPKTSRWVAQTNTRQDFVTVNKSCHPVAGACPMVSPSSVLVSPWTTASVMKCGDCHNNNAGPGAGGTGPNGPHGSTNPSLLERSYTGTRPAMCAKCHTTTYVKFNGSNSHLKHTGDIAATCNTCHDPHGSPGTPSMINFDRSQVTSFTKFTPSTAGQANNGSCTLTCHGENHQNCSYTNC